jgi:hypothetical protein
MKPELARKIVRTGLALAALASVLSACSPRATRNQSQVVGGLKLDYGLIAGEEIRAHPVGHPEADMHKGPPSDLRNYHVVLAVFEAGSGRRIPDADVSMALSGPGHPGFASIPMEPMRVTGQESYGRYVVLPKPGPYRLEFRVRTVGRHQPVRARFELQRPD